MTAAHLRGPEVKLPKKPGCTGKNAYPSRNDARAASQGIGGFQIYHCRFCRQWHLSHMKKPAPSTRAALKAMKEKGDE